MGFVDDSVPDSILFIKTRFVNTDFYLLLLMTTHVILQLDYFYM